MVLLYEFQCICYGPFTKLSMCFLSGSKGLEKVRPRIPPIPVRESPPPRDGPEVKIAATTFTFRELATATKNFRQECLIGEGGFGRVYKGRIETTGQVFLGLDW